MSPTLAFGDDHSEAADRCWSWIVQHHWDGWSLEVVTAQPSPEMRPVPESEADLHPWQPEDPREAGDIGFTSVTHLRAEVDPRVALIAKPWELVAIGPRGAGFLKSLHMGSTADWLLREPRSPLVIARHPGPVRTILVAADGSSHAGRALDTIASLPWVGGVTVQLVAVDDGRVDAGPTLDDAASTLEGCGAVVEKVTREGDPTREIAQQIEETGPELVAMGARGRGGFRRLVVGSTTAAIAGSTDRSILVAHALGDEVSD